MDLTQDNARPDGTQKGGGFFGLLKRPDGKVSTEISIGLDMGGKEVNVPLLVPSLTPEELNYLLQTDVESKDFLKNIPRSIMEKAYTHAQERMKAGISPFALPDEIAKFTMAPKKMQEPETVKVQYEDPFSDTTK